MTRKRKSKMCESNRQFVNCVSLFLVFLVLFVSAQVTSVSSLEANLRNEDVDIYENITNNGNYVYSSGTLFEAQGMEGLYNMTVGFMDLILQEIDPNDFAEVNDGSINIKSIDVDGVLSKYAGVLTVCIILAILTILTPLCGLLFCCCRCCGNCGGKARVGDPKDDRTKKLVFGGVLIACGLFLLFCMVGAFASTEQMNAGLKEFSDNIRADVKIASQYLDNTKMEVNTLLSSNFQIFRTQLSENLKSGTQAVREGLLNTEPFRKANATFDNAAEQIKKWKNTFIEINTNLANLKPTILELNDAVRQTTQEITNICGSGSPPVCSIPVDNLHVIDYNKLDTQEISGILSKINTTGFSEKKEKFFVEFDKMIDDALNQATGQLENAQNTINENSDEVLKIIDEFKQLIDNNTGSALDDTETTINDYSGYLYYPLLAVSIILLVIFLLLAAGIIFGTCGKHTGSPRKNCCDKSIGSKLLISAVMFIFIFTIIFGLITLITFLFGMVTQRIFCDSLRNTDNSKVVSWVDDLIGVGNLDVNVSISSIFNGCDKDTSIYEVFNLRDKFDVEEVKENVSTAISKSLNELDIGAIIGYENATIITPAIKESIEELNGFDIAAIEETIQIANNIDFNNVRDNIDFAIEHVPTGTPAETISELTALRERLEVYNTNLLEKILVFTGSMESTIHDFKAFKNDTLGSILELDLYLNGEGKNHAIENIDSFKTSTNGIVQGYLNFVVDSAKQELGRCTPLMTAVDGLLTATCEKILIPINGFWFSLFWSLITFIPVVIVSIYLSILYQKEKKGSLVYETMYPRNEPNYYSAPRNPMAESYSKEQNKTRYDDVTPKFYMHEKLTKF